MNNLNEERLKIAVFIDLENIAIGVKQSMNRNFEVGTVLEAIKEKGEIITKIAYGDWKRSEDFSRAMTQHAIQMVQRNATPGGDKNGADIALALDALETAFTRPHINAFVIVGGDSDFIALVEKLKQYDKTVFVVGGRGFTSIILQKNCHEFISYENLVGVGTSRKIVGKIQLSTPSTMENALPLIRRALKILSDREVSPQLGLLKSTLLQLDSTFSERDYGVSSFRDFVQKLADAGYIYLKQVDRSLLVELKETGKEEEKESVETVKISPQTAPPPEEMESANVSEPAVPSAAETQPAPVADLGAALEEIFRDAKIQPHWPMYLRAFKQLLKSLQPSFDERQYGFSSTYDLVRQAQRDGLLHIERNRQGILRIFPGDRFPKPLEETPLPDASNLPDSATESPQFTSADAPVAPETPEPSPAASPDASSQTEISASEPLAGLANLTSPIETVSPETPETTTPAEDVPVKSSKPKTRPAKRKMPRAEPAKPDKNVSRADGYNDSAFNAWESKPAKSEKSVSRKPKPTSEKSDKEKTTARRKQQKADIKPGFTKPASGK